MSDDRQEFARRVAEQVAEQGRNREALHLSKDWMIATWPSQYSYHFSWLGLPIIQYPTDIVATQELIWGSIAVLVGGVWVISRVAA